MRGGLLAVGVTEGVPVRVTVVAAVPVAVMAAVPVTEGVPAGVAVMAGVLEAVAGLATGVELGCCGSQEKA